MSVRNCLKAGDFVEFIPIGLPITIQYNEDGNVQKCYIGFNEESNSLGVKYGIMPNDLLNQIISSKIIPTSISIKTGFTRVSGILYTKIESLPASGNIPFDIINTVISKFKENPSIFTFYAVSMNSTSLPINGSNNQRNWLMMSKFKTLPGMIVPININKSDELFEMLRHMKYSFGNYNIMACAVFKGNKVEYFSNTLSQFLVKNVNKFVLHDGRIRGVIELVSGRKFSVDYSVVVNYNIQPGMMLVFDSDSQIIHSYSTLKNTDTVSSTMLCKFCGRHFNVPKSGEVYCPDDDCPSRLPERLSQFLSVLKMPVIDKDLLQQYVFDKTLTCISDIFTLDMYKEFDVNTNLTNLLRALIPYEYLHSDNAIVSFVNGCQNNSLTFEHYLHQPDKIIRDLNLTATNDIYKLIDWLKKPYNLSDISCLLGIQNISISKDIKQFNGAPIFRGKTIYITGRFIHGQHSDIKAILQSYDSKVVDLINSNEINNLQCVVIGGLNEDTNGEIVNTAINFGIPVFTESEFFNKYGIDEDLSTLHNFNN